MVKKPTPKKAVPKKAAPVKKAPPKKVKNTDPFEIPRFLNRWIGKTEIVKLISDDKGNLIKVDKKGNKYDAATDKVIKK